TSEEAELGDGVLGDPAAPDPCEPDETTGGHPDSSTAAVAAAKRPITLPSRRHSIGGLLRRPSRRRAEAPASGPLLTRLPLLGALRHLVGRDVLDVRCDPPVVPGRVLHTGRTVSIELVGRPTERGGARLHRGR